MGGLHYELHKKRLELLGVRKRTKKIGSWGLRHDIDFVVTWVDGNDSEWQKQKNEYEQNVEKKGNGEERYRDWDQFMYWFRSVEKYAPWVNNVYLITWGHVPKWLNTEYSKLKIIRHEEYMPKEYLPTFNSTVIELNMFRISELSEKFVYFNDDMYLTKPVTPNDFFEGDLPKYCSNIEQIKNYGYNGPFVHQSLSVMGVINETFNIQRSIEEHPEKWFCRENKKNKRQIRLAYDDSYLPGIYCTHLGCPYRKSTLERVWGAIGEKFHETCLHRFRTPFDIMHQVFSIWEIMEGNFEPVEKTYYGQKFGSLSTQLDDIEDAILNQKYRMVCLNDSVDVNCDNFEDIKKKLDEILAKTFPEKSSFEK